MVGRLDTPVDRPAEAAGPRRRIERPPFRRGRTARIGQGLRREVLQPGGNVDVGCRIESTQAIQGPATRYRGLQEQTMIQLGSYDEGVSAVDRDADLQAATAASGLRGDRAEAGSDFLTFAAFKPEPSQPMTVADLQQALVTLGFFPGGKVDGICGYRTRAAMRLFQEYVRSVEKLPSVP